MKYFNLKISWYGIWTIICIAIAGFMVIVLLSTIDPLMPNTHEDILSSIPTATLYSLVVLFGANFALNSSMNTLLQADIAKLHDELEEIEELLKNQ